MKRIIVFYKTPANNWRYIFKRIKRESLIFQPEDPMNFQKLRFHCNITDEGLEVSLDKFFDSMSKSPLLDITDLKQISNLKENFLKKRKNEKHKNRTDKSRISRA